MLPTINMQLICIFKVINMYIIKKLNLLIRINNYIFLYN